MKHDHLILKERVPLSKYTTFGIGGPARYVAEPQDLEELREALLFAEEEGLPYLILGGGSNVLFHDEGFEGVVIRMARMNHVEVKGEVLEAEAGTTLKRLINVARDAGLSGLEPFVGIPGELGGAIVMNAGLKGHEIGDRLVSVTLLTFDGYVEELPPQELGLAYRRSRVRDMGIIVKARLRLVPGDTERIDQEIQNYLEHRKSTQPYGMKSAGCVFKNPAPDVSAGKLLDDAGLKGYRLGDAMYSEKHANFIVNLNQARAEDVLALMDLGKQRVREMFGYELEEEIVVLDPWGNGV